MATASQPKGRMAELLIRDETTFGSAASGDYVKTLFYSDGLQEAQPNEDDPVLGLAQNNTRDMTDPAPGLPDTAGDIVVPLDLNHIWYWLKGLFGAPSTSGSSDYTHTFTSGGYVLPHRTIEKKVDSALFYQYTGMLANTLSLEGSLRGGYDRATVGLMGRKETKLTSTAGGTPASILARDPLLAALPILKVGGSLLGKVIAFSAVYNNGASKQDYLGDPAGYPLGHDLDNDASFSGTLRMRFANATIDDYAKARTALGFEFLWENSATRSLSIAAPRVFLEPTGKPVGGPGRIEQTFNWKAAQSSDAAMVTVTLKSGTSPSSNPA